MISTYLLTGSNSGDRGANLTHARIQLEKHAGSVFIKSHVYESEPWGFVSMNLFFNQVLGLLTDIPVESLLEVIFKIEKDEGRNREGSSGYADRSLDIDILFYGSSVIQTGDIEIPHPRLHLRKFTLVPLAEVAPYLVHPVLKETVIELLDKCDDTGQVRKLWL